MQRIITMIHTVHHNDDLPSMIKVMTASGGNIVRSGRAELYYDKKKDLMVEIMDPYVIGNYVIDDMDFIKSKAETLTEERGIKEIIMYGRSIPVITKTTLSKMTQIPITSGLGVLIANLVAHPFVSLGEFELPISVISIIGAFTLPFILPYMSEHAQRREMKDAYDVADRKLVKKTFGSYEHLINTSE